MARLRRDEPQTADWQDVVERLRRLALALSRDPHEADDLTQQTLAELLARRPDRASHVGYARQTLTRLWLDRQRARRRRWLAWLRLAAGFRESAPAARGDPEQHARLDAAIADLPPPQRAALALRLIEDLDYAEIADVLGCSVAAVRANLHLARRALRAAEERDHD